MVWEGHCTNVVVTVQVQRMNLVHGLERSLRQSRCDGTGLLGKSNQSWHIITSLKDTSSQWFGNVIATKVS